MKLQTIRRYGIPAAIALGPVAAFAQASSAFTDAVSSASADIATYGAALVGVSAVGVVFMVAIKYVKKIRGAA